MARTYTEEEINERLDEIQADCERLTANSRNVLHACRKDHPLGRGQDRTDLFRSAAFVLSGRHGAGAARFAAIRYGAEEGVGEGLTGRAYAVPTKDAQIRDMPASEIEPAIGRFVEFTHQHPDLTFLLTPVGCGLAGHSIQWLWSVLARAGLPSNVHLTASWINDYPSAMERF